MGKKNWNNTGIPEADQKVFWEDLMELKDKTVQELFGQQALTQALINSAKEYFVKDPGIKDIIVGILNTYKDIATSIRANMEFHITMDEEGKIKDYKMGEVNINDDSYLDFLRITSNYINAQEQLAHISCTSYAELVTRLAMQDPSIKEEVSAEDFINIKEKGMKEIEKTMQGVKNATRKRTQQPRAKSTTNTERSTAGAKARAQSARRKG